MSRHKKNSVAYTIPANNDSDDDDDINGGYQTMSRHDINQSRSRMMNPVQQMNSMINSMLTDPFSMFGGMGGMGGRRGRQNELMPFGFPNMNDIFESFQMNANDPNCHSFSSRTVMAMSSGPDGRPQVYQASQSTRTAPGGIRETKKSVCDSRTGTKKMAIGHHIGDRSHVLEREQNMHSGEQEERQEFINLDEDEAEEFNREWESKTRETMNSIGYGAHRSHSRRPREDIPAILDRYRPPARNTMSRRHNYPAITSSPSSEHTAERAKKRYHEEHVISSDEEEEEVVVKTHKARKTATQRKKH